MLIWWFWGLGQYSDAKMSDFYWGQENISWNIFCGIPVWYEWIFFKFLKMVNKSYICVSFKKIYNCWCFSSKNKMSRKYFIKYFIWYLILLSTNFFQFFKNGYKILNMRQLQLDIQLLVFFIENQKPRKYFMKYFLWYRILIWTNFFQFFKNA